MSIYIHKSHNVSNLIYHIVFPVKYRLAIMDREIEVLIKKILLEISKRYEVYFLEIGCDRDHLHLLIQTVPMKSVTEIVKMIKSITAKELYKRKPEIRKDLWGGSIWTSGYYVNTVSKNGTEGTVSNYVKNQGRDKEYRVLHKDQLKLLE